VTWRHRPTYKPLEPEKTPEQRQIETLRDEIDEKADAVRTALDNLLAMKGRTNGTR
jgi:hypothetical protein